MILSLVGCKADKADDSGLAVDCTSAALPLCINEIMADNRATITDERGQAGDWIELYNGGEEKLSLDGLTITDKLDEPDRYAFPDGLTIKAGDWLLLWADGDPEAGPEHLDIKLEDGGEEVGIFLGDGTAVDRVEYKTLPSDVAAARVPDGGVDWEVTAAATPGAANVADQGTRKRPAWTPPIPRDRVLP